MVFALFVLALALVPGLQCSTVQTMDIPSIPSQGQVQIQTLPAFIFDDEPVPEVPVQRPLPVLPESEAIHPELILPEAEAVNPCDSCFQYLTELIGQLSEVATPELIPIPMPEVEVIQPEEEEGGFQILPHPMPQVEVVEQPETRPIPSSYLRM